MASPKFIIRSITVRNDQDLWLRDHHEINFSRWVQKKIDEELMGKR